MSRGEEVGLGALLVFLGLTSFGDETIGDEFFLFSAVAMAELSGFRFCFGRLKRSLEFLGFFQSRWIFLNFLGDSDNPHLL